MELFWGDPGEEKTNVRKTNLRKTNVRKTNVRGKKFGENQCEEKL